MGAITTRVKWIKEVLILLNAVYVRLNKVGKKLRDEVPLYSRGGIETLTKANSSVDCMEITYVVVTDVDIKSDIGGYI